jgi:hypothetical protein
VFVPSLESYLKNDYFPKRELVPLIIPLLTANDVKLNCASVAVVKFLGEFKFWATETRLLVSDLLFVVKLAFL